MTALLLLLLDSRSPAGAHTHSGGMEAAIGLGQVRTLADVEAFCRTRLATAGVVAAAFAAAACDPDADLDALDAELDARTPSEAMRATSRQLGRGLARMVRAMVPGFAVPTQHHPLVLGAAVLAAGGTPPLAARAAGLGTVAVPASGAVRLLGLDPFAVQGMLARLAGAIDDLPVRGDLPAFSAPELDLLADYHQTTEVRLFAS